MHEGQSLAEALRRYGHSVVVDTVGLPRTSISRNLIRLVNFMFKYAKGFDVVITESFDYNGLLAFFLSISRGIPFVIYVKGFYPEDSLETSLGFMHVLDDWVSEIIFSQADHIAYLSNYLSEKYTLYYHTKKLNLNSLPATIIYHSIDETYFEINEVVVSNQIKRVLFAGNLEFKGKADGVRLLVELFNTYTFDHDVVLSIVGAGKYFSSLRTLVQDSNTNKIIFHGFLSTRELKQLYRDSYVFVYPSFQDALSSVTLEAQAMGLPAVVTNTSGAQEIVVDGVTGFICDPDLDSLYSSISRILDDQALRDRMSIAAKHHIKKNFTWDITAHKFNSILQKLISNYRK